MIALHGIGSRQDLPLPFEWVLVGAAVTLCVTFGILIFAWRTPKYDRPLCREVPRLGRIVDHRVTVWSLRVLVAGIWAIAAAALIGGVDRIDNPVFGFVYVWVWVGLVPLSLLFGRVWRATNPARTLLALTGTERQPTSRPPSVLPAALALVGFSFLELVQPGRTTLPVLRVWIAIWLVWILAGTVARGTDWIGSADPFEVYASSLARLSPWTRSPRGVLAITSPLRHLASWTPPRHLAAVAVVLLGGTAYDSFSNVLWWVQFTQSSELPREIWGTLGLVTMIAIVAVTYYGGAAALRLPGFSIRAQADLLAPGLIPIVAGYALAHYGTLLWLEGQRTAIQLSDPLGKGWNIFGTAELGVNTAIIGWSGLIATLQVLFIVGGHVLGVLVSHDIAIRRRTGGQVPLLAVMVFYTLSGLLLLFA